MIILKYTILFIIFSGVSFVGILFSRKYKNREEELKEFKEICNILEAKIKFTYEPLGDILEDISDMSEFSISWILKESSMNLKKYDFKESWERAIDEQKQNMNLKEEDINIIKSLGKMLRKNRHTGATK